MKVAIAMLVLASAITSGCRRSASEDASTFPSRPVTLVVGRSPGGGQDTAVRGLQPYLQRALGTAVIVENKPGNNGLIAANQVAEARPDGYTLIVGTNSTILNSQIYPESWKSPQPVVDSFIPLYCWVNADGNGIVVKKEAAFNSMDDLAAEAKKRPVRLCIAGGLGSTDHVTALFIRKLYGGEWIVVPMDSGSEATAAVLGGKCDAASGSPASSSMDTRTLKMLAVTMDKRARRWPDAPTFAELGKPEATLHFIIGAMAPLGTPQQVVDKLAAAFEKARNDPGFIAWAEKTDQPIGDEGWDARKYTDFLRRSEANMQAIIPEMREELRKTQEGK